MSINQNKLSNIITAPIISEKSTSSAENNNTFVFKVRKEATKKQVGAAVEQMFDVEVAAVRVLNVNGKKKRFGRVMGKRKDWKKAYVKLKPGHDIEFSAA